MRWQVTIVWTETSDVKLKFLEIFEACGNLIYCSCEEIDKNFIYLNTFSEQMYFMTYIMYI